MLLYSILSEIYFQLELDMKFTANKIAGILREKGYKLTPQRHAVLKVIATAHDHLTPEEIYKKARNECLDVGLVTVYRTLDLLEKLKLVCRLHTGNGCRSYLMRRPSEHHHHLICSSCGRVVDFSDCDLTDLEEKLASSTSFSINEHLLEFYGLCPACQGELNHDCGLQSQGEHQHGGPSKESI